MSLSFLKDIETVGIIGTAGRRSDASKLSEASFEKMCDIASSIIGDRKVHLISGGAPWADHVAVCLYLYSKLKHDLTIEFPCDFIDGKYVEGQIYDGYDTGKTSNHYHREFYKKTSIDSISELQQAIEQGAVQHSSKGFFDRNNKVAKADIMIAFTFGNGPKLKDGGTAHTARCYIENGGTRLYHHNLNDGITYFLDEFPV